MQDIGESNEDCLHLNVWTPACDARRRPVMVWIHGGGFSIGSGSQEMYEASELARRGDVVVVSPNYRLGALGFSFFGDLFAAELDLPSNLGLRDQLAALAWVRDNIEAFGGDPDNVTVFGESAGGMSIGSLLAAPAARGLFRRAIAQSGAAHHATTRAEATRMTELMLRGIGARPGHPERLWSASAHEIVVAQRLCWRETVLRGPKGLRLPQGAMTLLPVGDDEFLPDGPFDAIARGEARGIDLMVGSTADEWNYFMFFVEPNKRDIDEAVLKKICDKRLHGRGQQAIDCYRSVLGETLSPWLIYAAIESDRMFRIPALRLAEAHSAHHRATFLYEFDFRSPLFDGEMGACHAIEVPFVFGTVDGAFGAAFTGGGPLARELSQRTLAAWASFARSGDPNHESLPRWPVYETSRRATMRLAPTCVVEAAPRDALRPFWDGLQ